MIKPLNNGFDVPMADYGVKNSQNLKILAVNINGIMAERLVEKPKTQA